MGICWGGGQGSAELSVPPPASCHEGSQVLALAFGIPEVKAPLTPNTVYPCVRLIAGVGSGEGQKRS